MRAGSTLVVAQGSNPGLRQCFRDKAGATIGSWQEWRIPIAVSGAAARHHHYSRNRPGARWLDQRAIYSRRVHLPCDFRTLSIRIWIGHSLYPFTALWKTKRATAQLI